MSRTKTFKLTLVETLNWCNEARNSVSFFGARVSRVRRGDESEADVMTTKTAAEKLKYLEDRWDEKIASGLDDAELLRYRSNLLGSDLRITNFGGGNTSS